MAYDYRGIAASHVQVRFFPTPSGYRPCYSRIQKLIAQRFLRARRLPSVSGIGSGRLFLTLDTNGKQAVAKALGLASRQELARLRIDAPRFIEHHLALCDSRLRFTLAAQQSRLFELLEWTADREVVIHVTDPDTDTTVGLEPDSTFTLALADGSSQRFCLEQDAGTIPKRMRSRLRAYLLRAGAEHGVPVLWVVPDRLRQHWLLHLALDAAAAVSADPTVFWVTTQAALARQDALADAIWHLPGVATPVCLTQVVAPEAAHGPPSQAAATRSGGLAA
jgi:hypothetical protein